MSNSITIFNFEENQVRTVLVDGIVGFVAKDVLKAMDSTTKVTELKAMIEEDLGDEFVTNEYVPDNLGRMNKMLVLSKPAVTLFLSRSRTKLGKAMNRWLHTEVIPSIEQTGSYSLQPQPPQPELPSWEKAVKVADSISHIQKTLRDQPRLTQFLTDQALQTYGNPQKQLAEADLRGVAEIAEEMGLPVSFNNRSQLAKYCKTQVGNLGKQEKRLCNGKIL
mgnify:CR=1 FL=1